MGIVFILSFCIQILGLILMFVFSFGFNFYVYCLAGVMQMAAVSDFLQLGVRHTWVHAHVNIISR